MRTPITLVLLVMLCTALTSLSHADTNTGSLLRNIDVEKEVIAFPDLSGNESDRVYEHQTSTGDMEFSNAFWPFDGNDDIAAMQPKSTRKAFFLSLLLPGLGEMYVGSKRAFLFLGIEAFAWYTYFSNNSEGNDLEDDYQAFADKYWHYTDTVNSNNDPLYYNYWGYIDYKYDLTSSGLTSEDYDEIAEIIKNSGESHSLPSTKTQQYYEMIGKYDHFVYGWEDIIDLNSKLQLINNDPNYNEDTGTITSHLRNEYMDMRGKSNDKLKAAQRGLYIMMINRVLSAIDAGRLAYKHNKKLDSDLSMTRIRMAQKRINNELVPMLIVYRSF